MCNCRNGNSTPQSSSAPAQQFVVSLPNGQTTTVNSEHEARVTITRAGGGTFSRK